MGIADSGMSSDFRRFPGKSDNYQDTHYVFLTKDSGIAIIDEG